MYWQQQTPAEKLFRHAEAAGSAHCKEWGSESGLLKVQQQQLTSRDILVILLDEISFQTGSYHINRVSESEHKLLFSWQAFFLLAFHQASTALCSTHLWKIHPLYLHLLSIQHQLLYLLPPKQNGSHWFHCVIEPECEPVVSMVEEPCCIKIGDLKEVIQQKWAIGIPKDIDPLTLDQWKVSVIDELQCEVTTPILPLSSQPALWLNISGPWEVIFWKLQIN